MPSYKGKIAQWLQGFIGVAITCPSATIFVAFFIICIAELSQLDSSLYQVEYRNDYYLYLVSYCPNPGCST